MPAARQRILAIGAHPDDCEFCCGGCAALWAGRGHEVCFVSVTNGQSGHHALGGAELVRRRMAEAAAAAGVIGIQSRVLPIADGHLEPTLANRLMLIRLIRQFQADLVLTHRPNDYHPDHRYTSILVQDSAYMLTVPHVAPEVPALRANPVMLYFQDRFRKPAPFEADVAIDIDAVFEKKIAMLHRHESQVYEWLPWLDGIVDQVPGDEAGRVQWLKRWYAAHRPPMDEQVRRRLVERYGQERGGRVENVEAFEVCEYGARLDRQAFETLFGGM